MTSTRQHTALLIHSVTDNSSLNCISSSKGKRIVTFQLQEVAKCKPGHFSAPGTSHHNVSFDLVTYDCNFNAMHHCAHRKGCTSRAQHVVRSRYYHSSLPLASTALLLLVWPLSWLPAQPQPVTREVPAAQDWGCPRCPLVCPASGWGSGALLCHPMGTPPAASLSPQGAILPCNAQAAANSRV